MSNTHRRPLGQVSNWHPATNDITPRVKQSTFAPHGLTLRHTIFGGTITGVSGNGTTVTYTCRNNFTAGDRVSIVNVLPTAYNLTNVQVATASATQFTVTNAATGTFVRGGNAFTYFQIPTGITWVYALVVGSGANATTHGGGAGGISWGWTPASNVCIVGSPGPSSTNFSNHSRYGCVIAGGGGGSSGPHGPGGGGGGGLSSGATSYWGVRGGTFSSSAFGAGGFGGNAQGGTGGGNGGDGISGGAGQVNSSTTVTAIGGNGGSGFAGGGGGSGGNTSGARIGGTGGNGRGIDGTVYTGGTGSTGTGGSGGGAGGGAGMLGNGSNASGTTGGNGGLGGGGGGGAAGTAGFGGNGFVYIWY